MARPASPLSTFCAPTAGIHERAEIVEPVRRDQSRRHQLPQAAFHFCRQMSGRTDEVGKETRAPFGQRSAKVLRNRTQGGIRIWTWGEAVA
jgi:hypothetical protein